MKLILQSHGSVGNTQGTTQRTVSVDEVREISWQVNTADHTESNETKRRDKWHHDMSEGVQVSLRQVDKNHKTDDREDIVQEGRGHDDLTTARVQLLGAAQ